jgi:hypothetical protein
VTSGFYQSDKKEGKGFKSDSSFWRRAFRRHLLEVDDFVARLLEGHSNVLRRGVIGQVSYNSFLPVCLLRCIK